MSNRLFQGVIHQMKDAIDRIIGVIDENGVVIACSELVKIGEIRQGIRDEVAYASDMVAHDGYTYRPIIAGNKADYIVFVEGEDKMADKVSRLLAISLGNIKNLYDEKNDKGSFIKTSYSTTFCPAIFISRAKNCTSIPRKSDCILIKFYGKTDILPFEMVQNMFSTNRKIMSSASANTIFCWSRRLNRASTQRKLKDCHKYCRYPEHRILHACQSVFPPRSTTSKTLPAHTRRLRLPLRSGRYLRPRRTS